MAIKDKLIAVVCFLSAASFSTTNVSAKAVGSDENTSSYYKDFPQFHQYPTENSRGPQIIHRFGPVGIGIELTLPAFGMKVSHIEEGSPAAATGKLKPGQVIDSINGKKLVHLDPRVILGNIITEAEATNGQVKLMIKANANAQPQEVLVQIPVLGAYSATWPMNCEKSNKIVRGQADYLAKNGNRLGALSYDQGLLFLLSTGEDKDLEVARAFAKEIVEKTKDSDMSRIIPWGIGYGGPALCEYYLRTGDKSVLPTIEKLAAQAARLMYNGGWNQRTIVNFKYGHMNAAGVHVVRFLLLAKECGAQVDDYTLQTSLKHFFRFVGRGNVPYGDGLPEPGFVDNGKVGGLAFAMAAAANLTPDGENSIYAKARDISAVKSFYSTSWMLHGHTGGGIGEIWRSAAMGLMPEKKPTKYREFMDDRRWHYELSRRFDGSMAILRDTPYSRGYDNAIWGSGYAMTYTVPRKTLRMTGAPPTKYSKTFKLPEQPWGNAADNVFYSLVPAADKDGKIQDIDSEKLVTDASWPILRKVNSSKVTDDVLLMYSRHPDYNVRQMAASAIRKLGRDHLIMELLKDKDPRVRGSGIMVICIDTTGASFISKDRFTDEMADFLGQIISDKDEAWWNVQNAMMALSIADPKKIAPHIETLLQWLGHEEWWMQRAAMAALEPLVDNPKYASNIIPAITYMASKNTVNSAVSLLPRIAAKLSNASPSVQKLGAESFASAYAAFPVDLRARGGADMANALPFLHGSLASALVGFPDGYNQLFSISRKILPEEPLAYKHLYFKADQKKFGPEIAKVLPKLILREMIPNYISENIGRILDEARWFTTQERYKRSQFAYGAIDGLVKYYNENQITDYNWHTFGPKRDEITWDYYSYDLPADVRKKLDKVNNPMTFVDRHQIDKNRLEKAVRQLDQWKIISQREIQKVKSAKSKSPKGRKVAEEAIANQKKAKKNAIRAYKKANEGMLFGVLPKNMENWYAANFRPSSAGWKKGKAPFGNVNGKLAPSNHCKTDFCGCGATPKNLWEKDVLLMRTSIKVPPLKPDHRYRLLIGGNVHPRQGGPLTVYINGKAVHQQGGFLGRLRAKPRGFFIDKSMLKDFERGTVNIGIAAVRPPKAHLTVWLEEMKMPPLGEKEISYALLRTPMMSSDWQMRQNPMAPAADSNDDKYFYSGKFERAPEFYGEWKIINRVSTIDGFTGEKKKKMNHIPFETVSLFPGGKTTDEMWIWSGNMLLSIEKKEALVMEILEVKGEKFLFLECGGFKSKHPVGWQTGYFVLEKISK